MKVFNVFEDASLAVDDDEPDGYRAPYAKVHPAIGGDRLAASLVALGPGQAVCPYHYEHGEEEWLIVLSGTPVVRTPAGEETVEPGDVICFPRGPAGAHKISNAGPEPARILIVSEHALVSATTYSDSDKVGIFDPGTRLLFRRTDAVDYWDGE
jgi:uncharacterized cupin superfamily protein